MSDSEDIQHQSDKAEAYDQLRSRTDALGFRCVNEAIDWLEKHMSKGAVHTGIVE